ncbi:MAG: M48 family metalloprotease [Gammaproteobacteria bacterium]|nr:M48 family metalloprotease [Gammaproteobacteria bacterium]
MDYQNPKIPEGINTSTSHPLKEFFLLTTGVLGVVAIAALLFALLAEQLAIYIPFETELKWAEKITEYKNRETNKQSEPNNVIDSKDTPMKHYLDELAAKISTAQALPPEMKITVHYQDSDVINAFATLGGHVFLFRGLLEELPNENAVAMVLAHEIAHIKHRHPIRSAGRGIIIGMALTMVSSALGNSMINQVLTNTGGLAVLKFSRDQEDEADQTALESLRKIYGHVFGASELFEIMQQAESTRLTPEFLSTHPLSQQRINAIHTFQSKHNIAEEIKLTPLPDGLFKVLTKQTTPE